MGWIETHISLFIANFLSVLLNIITIVAIIAIKKLRKKQNIFICNIAMADCVASCLPIVFWLRGYIEGRGDPNTALVTRASLVVETGSTLSVALYRLIVIRYDPFNKRNLVTAPRCIVACIFIWIIPIGGFFVIETLTRDKLLRIQNIIIFIISVVAQCLCVTCYAVVYLAIASAGRKAGLTGRMLEQRVSQNKSILATFALVSVSSVLCLFPVSFGFFITFVRIDWVVNAVTFETYRWFVIYSPLSFTIMGLNGIINPIIYWTRLTEFRKCLQGLGDLCLHNKRSHSESNVTTESGFQTSFKQEREDSDRSGKQVINTVSK